MTTVFDKIQTFQEKMFDFIIFTSYALIFLSVLGLSKYAPIYLDDLEYYVKIYVCVFLLWRFNPLRKVVFTDLDRKIAFSAGLFILTTTAIDKYFKYFTQTAKTEITKTLPVSFHDSYFSANV